MHVCSCRIYIQTAGRGKQSVTKLTTRYGDKDTEKEDSEVAGKAQYGDECLIPALRRLGQED